MLFSSTPWQALLYMTVLFLGLLAQDANAISNPFSNLKTSDVFQLLTDKPDYGGSCGPYITAAKADKTKKLPNPEDAISETLTLCNAALDALSEAIKDADPKKMKKDSYRQNRKRILLLSRRLWGAKIDPVTLEHTTDSSKDTLKEVQYAYDELKGYITGKTKTYRLACDDTWAERVTKLETKFDDKDKGTPVKDMKYFAAPFTGEQPDYVWWDRTKTGDNIPDAYFVQDNWNPEGPCSKGINKEQRDSTKKYARVQGEEMEQQKMIYICPGVWKLESAFQIIGKSLKPYVKDEPIATDGKESLDKYLTPGGVILHEMGHQILYGKDGDRGIGFGYGFYYSKQGKNDPAGARLNPDSYVLFGAAMYLSKYDWSEGVARELSAMVGESGA